MCWSFRDLYLWLGWPVKAPKKNAKTTVGARVQPPQTSSQLEGSHSTSVALQAAKPLTRAQVGRRERKNARKKVKKASRRTAPLTHVEEVGEIALSPIAGASELARSSAPAEASEIASSSALSPTAGTSAVSIPPTIQGLPAQRE